MPQHFGERLALKKPEWDREAAKEGEPSTHGILTFNWVLHTDRDVDFFLQIIHIIIFIFVCMMHLMI